MRRAASSFLRENEIASSCSGSTSERNERPDMQVHAALYLIKSRSCPPRTLNASHRVLFSEREWVRMLVLIPRASAPSAATQVHATVFYLLDEVAPRRRHTQRAMPRRIFI